MFSSFTVFWAIIAAGNGQYPEKYCREEPSFKSSLKIHSKIGHRPKNPPRTGHAVAEASTPPRTGIAAMAAPSAAELRASIGNFGDIAHSEEAHASAVTSATGPRQLSFAAGRSEKEGLRWTPGQYTEKGCWNRV